jgi:hypothetical protein
MTLLEAQALQGERSTQQSKIALGCEQQSN